MRPPSFEGILLWCAVVVSLFGWLGSNVIASDVSRQELPFHQRKREPACTELKKAECRRKWATCLESYGDCVCDSGLLNSDGTCKEPACTNEKRQECTEKGATCREPYGQCLCNSGPWNVDGTCKEAALEESLSPTTSETSSARDATSAGTEPSQRESDPTTEHTLNLLRDIYGDSSDATSIGTEPSQRPSDPTTERTPELLRVNSSATSDPTTTGTETSEWPSDSTSEYRTAGLRVPSGAPSRTKDATSIGTEKSQQPRDPPAEHTTAVRRVTSGVPSDVAFEGSTGPSILRRSHSGDASTTETEPSEWQSDPTTIHTTKVRRVTPGAPSGSGECDDKVCKLPRCLCASDAPPAGLRVDEMPQFVMLTFDDAVNVVNMAFYRELLDNSRRKNKRNGCGIAATFFVSGEYLDYEAVNQLHSWGNEIALHSISHRTDSSYWQTINTTQWEREVLDQRAMVTAFAHLAATDVTGFRGPFLFTGGDQGFSMLHKHFRYDSTLVHRRFRDERPFYPYTMDFGFRRSCSVWPCPEGSYPGLWVLPMNVFFPKGEEGDLPCAMADACVPQPVTATDTFDYLKSNFDQFYSTNRAPFPVFLHEAYLRHSERKAGYLRFVDWLLEKDDVYLVTASEVLRFMEDPKPLSAYAKRTCAGRSLWGASTCPKPTTCSYKNTPPGGERYMRTCSQCPKNYPWVNNPLGN